MNRRGITNNRRSIRLKGYDYSQQGQYFITVCIKNKREMFGNIENDEMKLNDAGVMIQSEWLNLTTRFENISLDYFVVMPNHFHAILEIGSETSQNKRLGEMVGAFESITTVNYIRGIKNNKWKSFDGKLWQRNYWEHVIRDENEYLKIAQYIIDNPSRWNIDELNENNVKGLHVNSHINDNIII